MEIIITLGMTTIAIIIVRVFMARASKFHATLIARGIVGALDFAVTIGRKRQSLASGLLITAQSQLVIAFDKDTIIQLPYAEITEVFYTYDYTLKNLVGASLQVHTKLYPEPYTCTIFRQFTGDASDTINAISAGDTPDPAVAASHVMTALSGVGQQLVSKGITVQQAVAPANI